MKTSIKITSGIIISLLAIVGLWWFWEYSPLGRLVPMETIDEFEIKVVDYEIDYGGLLTPTTKIIKSEKRNLVVGQLYNYGLDYFDFNSLVKGDVLKCKKIKKGMSERYICGTEEKEIPNKDWDIMAKFIILIVLSLCISSLSPRH